MVVYIVYSYLCDKYRDPVSFTGKSVTFTGRICDRYREDVAPKCDVCRGGCDVYGEFLF